MVLSWTEAGNRALPMRSLTSARDRRLKRCRSEETTCWREAAAVSSHPRGHCSDTPSCCSLDGRRFQTHTHLLSSQFTFFSRLKCYWLYMNGVRWSLTCSSVVHHTVLFVCRKLWTRRWAADCGVTPSSWPAGWTAGHITTCWTGEKQTCPSMTTIVISQCKHFSDRLKKINTFVYLFCLNNQ